MKIDRVIFALNNNKTYTGFWNKFSEVLYKKFKWNPTLFFIGDRSGLNLSEDYGEIIDLPTVPEASSSLRCASGDPNFRDWYITSVFSYGPTLFPNDVCIIHGMDQLPLSHQFENLIKDVDNEKFVIGLSGAYCGEGIGMPHLEPSGSLTAKGYRFKEIFEVEDSWKDTVLKIYNTKDIYRPHLPTDDLWGLDEYYMSDKIKNHKDQTIFYRPMNCDYFNNYWKQRRIDRGWTDGYDVNLIKEGYYTECHARRPYEEHAEYNDGICNALLETI